MDNFTSLPSAISHKKLNALLVKAQKGVSTEDLQLKSSSAEKNDFDQLLLNWSSLSKDLMKILNKKESYVVEERNAKSIMALGALEAHLHLAIKALEAAEPDL